MRILELGKFYPPEHGGMETALREACRGLARSGHEVWALVSATDRVGRREELDGTVVRRLPRWATMASAPLCPGLPGAIRESLRELRPDVVHLHLPNPPAALAWSLAGDDRPLVVSYHSDIVRQRILGAVWSPWRRHLLRNASRIVVTSGAMRDESPALAGIRGRCTVVPLGVDMEAFQSATVGEVRAWNDELGERFFLFVGRLVYYKGLNVLLEALRGTVLPLVVVGDGPMRAEWQTLAQAMGMGEQVRFLGDLPDDKLRALYHACLALVLPSTAPSEAFGVVQLEAMACGRAVVASRASGGVESVHVEGETGLLVAPGDARALRDALLALWDDPELGTRLGRAGQQRVRAFFDSRRCVQRLESVLLEVTTGQIDGP